MNNRLSRIDLTQASIYLNAAIWFGFAVLVALHLHPAFPENPVYRWGMTGLALLTGGMLITLFRLARRWRPAYFLLLGLLSVIALLAITDEFGLADLAVLAINLLALFLLIVNREDFLIHKAD